MTIIKYVASALNRRTELLAAHPFPFVRSVARHAVLRGGDERNAAGQCYFRRDDNGEDFVLVFEVG